MRRLTEARTDEETIDALWSLANRRWRAAEELAHLADHENPEVREALAEVLGRYRGSAVRPLLTRLAGDGNDAVRVAAEDSLANPR